MVASGLIHSYEVSPGSWTADWAWGVPLIVVTVVIHVLGLGILNVRALRLWIRTRDRHHPAIVFAIVMGTMTLLATCLHALEVWIWAFFYLQMSALEDVRSAVLFSVGAMTTFAVGDISLDARWMLLGSIEALNGWLLFGLTTAFLFGLIQRMWSTRGEINVQ